MSGDEMRFAHAAARVRVLETRLLDRGHLERLLAAADVGEVLHILSETEYGPALAALKGGEDYEQALSAELGRVYAFVTSFAPEPRLLSAWAARHTFHNLKALLKAALAGEAVATAALSSQAMVDQERLAGVVAAAVAESGGPEGTARPEGAGRPAVSVPRPVVPSQPPQVRVGGTVGERVSGPAMEPYLARAAETAVAAFRTFGGPEEIDQAVDRVYQEYLLALAAVPGAAFLKGWVARWADLTNLRTFVRFALAGRGVEVLRRALLPGGALPPEELAQAFAAAAESGAQLAALSALAGKTPYDGLVAEGWRLFRAEGLLDGFEQLAEVLLLDYLRQARRLTFGFAPVWAYLMAKEHEVRLLRLILVGKSAGLTRERLRERVSDGYV